MADNVREVFFDFLLSWVVFFARNSYQKKHCHSQLLFLTPSVPFR